MSDSKTFTSYFNLADNFTAKFSGIQKLIKSITDTTHAIDFDIGGDVITQTQEIGKSLTESSAGINKAAGGAVKAAKYAGDGMKSAAEGAKGAKGEIEKSTSALEKMQSKFGGMTSTVETLKGKLGAITGLLTGGAIAGMAWSKAVDAASIKGSIMGKMERMHVNTDELSKFVDSASGLGYTTSTQRLNIADTVMSRTKLRGTKAEDASSAIEKLYFKDDTYWNKKGISSSEDLASLLTKKTLSRYDKQLLADMGIKGSSASSRIRSAEKLSKGLTDEQVEAADPMAALQNRMGEFTSKMGKTLVDPMLKVLGVANLIIDAINKIPGAPNLVALGMVLISASGAASLLATALGPLISLYNVLKTTTIANTVAAWAYNEATGVELVTANYTTAANLRMAASAIYRSVATKADAVSQTILAGSLSLSTIATWGLNTAMAVLDALDPFTYIIAGAAILAGIIGLVAYKSGLLGTIWKDLGKIKFGKVFDDLMKGNFDGAWKRLSKGMGSVWGDVKLGASLIPGEISTAITSRLTSLLSWASNSFSFLSKIHDVMKKVHSIFEWIYSLWQGFWSWIKTAIPGAAKETKRAEIEKLANKDQMTFDSSTGKLKWVDQMAHGGQIFVQSAVSEKISKKIGEWSKLPGFAEGIADAVKKGLVGIGTQIADAIKGAFPDFSGLITSLDKLIQPLKDLQAAINKYLGNDADKYKDDRPIYYSEKGDVYSRGGGNYDVVLKKDWNGNKEGSLPAELQGASWDTLVKYGFAEGDEPKSHASGVTFTRSGIYRAKFHSPEETLPQATTIRGPGIIARALEALDMGAKSSRLGESSNSKTEIHIHNSNDFSGLKVSNDYDLEKLFRQIDKRIESVSAEAVKKQLGQRRN